MVAGATRRKHENSIERLSTSKPGSIKRRHFETAVNEKIVAPTQAAHCENNNTLES